jgi:16S rRNA (cytosine967-C5)-methyltransferase
MTVSAARRAAFEVLRRVAEERSYAAVLLAALDGRMREEDRALCHELVLGVLRNQLWLDRIIGHFAQRDLKRIDLPVKLALRLALYQLRFLCRIPPSAALNESVNLVRAAGLRSAAGFVNAVLRRATREPDYDPILDAVDNLEKLSIETSHPFWLIEKWSAAFGFEEAAALARANNRPAPLAFRFTAKSIGSADHLLTRLDISGVNLWPSKIVRDAWRIARVTDLVGKYVLEGSIYFQDEASQLVAYLVAASSGDRVLDVCAAPGSKATQIAALSASTKVIAGDVHEHRVRTMRELAQRQGARIHLVSYDAAVSLPLADRSCDRVLVDAPCSGTGTIRHNPEIRWRLEPSDIEELSAKQKRILANAAATVKCGGRLIYSTCSIEPEENEEIVQNFLAQQSDFEATSFEGLKELKASAATIRTWPHRHDTDGFFVMVFERRK